MLWFLTCVAALVGGYFIYGAFVEKVFGINEKRQTPAHTKTDGVDYVPMSTPKVYLVQLLNIAVLVLSLVQSWVRCTVQPPCCGS